MAITSFTTAATATDPRDDGVALFDAYVVVDWSAAGQPKTGRDSIWFALYTREGGRLRRKALVNPATREAATADLGDRLAAQQRLIAIDEEDVLATRRHVRERRYECLART